MLTEEQLDLQLAARLQAALLPKGCPLECAHFVAGTHNRMCGSVGGDFYDFIRLNSDQYAIVIGDVLGHGVRAALLMAQITGFLRSDTSIRSQPTKMVAALNDMLCHLGDQTDSVMSCTMIYMVFDAPSGMSLMCNCGHPRPFLSNRERCTSLHLGLHDILLGVESFEPTEICHTFLPNERLVLHTDGLTEAMDDDHEMFGDQRLRDVISRGADLSPQQLADSVIQAVDEHRGDAEQTDDETIVVIDRV